MKYHTPLILLILCLCLIKVLSCDSNCQNCDVSTSECLECMDRYALSFSLCVQCTVANCFQCLTNENVCTTCQNGFVLDASGQCAWCLVPDCLQCQSQNSCKTCNQGFFANSLGECQACMEGCLKCSSESVCQQCLAPLYTLDFFTKVCFQCFVNNCLSCQRNNQCMECVSNYKRTSLFQCTLCQIPNCEECIADNICLKCQFNYQYKNNTCIYCPYTLNCSECKTDNYCKTCFLGFTNHYGTCVQCLINKCSYCWPENICNSCQSALTLSNNNCFVCQKENCKRCYPDNYCVECTELIYTLSLGSCNLCTLENCTECNQTNYCISCSVPYRPYLGVCYLCEQSSNCENNECSSQNKCVKCKNEYDMFEEQCVSCPSSLNCDGCLGDGICQKCKSGYLMYQSLCVECGIQNCKYCTLANKCKVCLSGFTYVNNKCLPCGSAYCSHCKNCSANSSFCPECTLLKYLSNEACLSSCDTGFFADNLTCTCKACNQSCSSCFGSASTQCFSCTPTYKKLANSDTCMTQCPSKTYTNQLTKQCVQCHQSCAVCIDGSQCQIVKNETVFFGIRSQIWSKDTSLLLHTLRFEDGLSSLTTQKTFQQARVLFIKSASRRLLSNSQNLNIIQVSVSLPNTVTILTGQPNNFQSIVLSNSAIQILLQANLLSANGLSYSSNSEAFNLDDPYFSGSFYRYFARSLHKNLYVFGYFVVVFAVLLLIAAVFVSGTSSKLFHQIMEFVLFVQCLGFLRLRWGSSNLGVYSFLDGFSQMELLFIPPVLSWGFPTGYYEESSDSAAFVWGNHNFIQQMSSIILVFIAFQFVFLAVFAWGKLKNWWVQEKYWSQFIGFEKGLIQLFIVIGIFYSTVSLIGLSENKRGDKGATFIVCQIISCLVLIISLIYILYHLRVAISDQFYKISCVLRAILMGCFCVSLIPIIVLICLFEVAFSLIESFLFWKVKMDLKGFVLCKVLMICCLAVGGTVDSLDAIASVLSIFVGVMGVVKGRYLVIEIMDKVKNRKIGEDKSAMDVSSCNNDYGDNKQIDFHVREGANANNQSRETVIVENNGVFTEHFPDLKYRNGIQFQSESQCEIADEAIAQNGNQGKEYEEGLNRQNEIVRKVQMQNQNHESLCPASITKLPRRKRRQKKEEETSQVEELNLEEQLADHYGRARKDERKQSREVKGLEVSFDGEEMEVQILENEQFKS